MFDMKLLSDADDLTEWHMVTPPEAQLSGDRDTAEGESAAADADTTKADAKPGGGSDGGGQQLRFTSPKDVYVYELRRKPTV